MKFYIVIALLSIMVSGCSTTMSKEELMFAQAQLERPTFSVECPTGGCNFSKFEYYDPSVQVAMPTNGYDAYNATLGSLTSILTGVTPYYFMYKGMSALADSGNSTSSNVTNSYQDQSTVTTTTSSTSDSFNPSTVTTTDTNSFSFPFETPTSN